MLSPLAEELNRIIASANPRLYEALSPMGKALYYPRGILTQTAEAKEEAHRYNATIGIAHRNGKSLYLDSIYRHFCEMDPDELFPYAPTFGLKALRETWREKIRTENPSLDLTCVSLPLVTSGITHGLSLAADLFVGRGDHVLLPDKAWGNYAMMFGVRYGATITKYPLLAAHEGLDIPGFRAALTEYAGSGKIVVVLNFPHNPTGYSPTRDEAIAIADCIKETAARGCMVIVLLDDSYFGLFYDDDIYRESLFSLLAGVHPNVIAVKLDGATKEYFVWGFRVGFITFGATVGANRRDVWEALEKKCAGAIRCGISNCPHPSQSIILRALQDPKTEQQRALAIAVLKDRALAIRKILSDEKFRDVWELYPFNSGYFFCLRLTKLNAEHYRVRLLNEYGIGVVATSDTDIRVAFSCVEASGLADLFEQMRLCALRMHKELNL